jgi:hypothetical protein
MPGLPVISANNARMVPKNTLSSLIVIPYRRGLIDIAPTHTAGLPVKPNQFFKQD